MVLEYIYSKNHESVELHNLFDWNSVFKTTLFDLVIKIYSDDKLTTLSEIQIRNSWILHLHTNPEYRNKGYGSLLLEKADLYIDDTIYLALKNMDLENFYSKRGYKIKNTIDGRKTNVMYKERRIDYGII